jgi:hypothetical protein
MLLCIVSIRKQREGKYDGRSGSCIYRFISYSCKIKSTYDTLWIVAHTKFTDITSPYDAQHNKTLNLPVNQFADTIMKLMISKTFFNGSYLGPDQHCTVDNADGLPDHRDSVTIMQPDLNSQHQ